MKKIILTFYILLYLFIAPALASDYHQNGQGHRVVYTIVDSNGKPVAGQTVNLALERSKDGYFYDFNDSTFKNSGWTSRVVAMSYDTVGEHYYRVISIDNGGIVSGDYAAIVSNDNATYSDHQTECVEFDSIAKLIKINR